MNPANLLAYVPVLHRGYLDFFARHPGVPIFLMGDDLTARIEHLRKDLRAVPAEDMALALAAVCVPRTVLVASESDLAAWVTRGASVIMPDEEECRVLAALSLFGCAVTYDPVFLRWDRTRALAKDDVRFDRQVPLEGVFAAMLGCARAEAATATNWWRQVGAVIVHDGEVLLGASNRHVPSPRQQVYEGDPRSLFSRGVNIELTTDFHAEARLIAEAARRGLSLDGASLYVTTFPCPPCAKLVAYSGIRTCYFSSGYAMLDGESILRAQGVELVHVQEKTPRSE